MSKIKITTTMDCDLWNRAERVAKLVSEMKGENINRNDLIEESLSDHLTNLEFEILQNDFINDLKMADAEDY